MKDLNLKDKTALVYDYGLFTELAARLARDFKTVYYYVPWQDAFPKSTKSLIGEGFDGLVRIKNFWDYVDKVDLIYVPDTHCGDLVEFLKNHKYPVCGVGAAEELELNRWLGRQKQKQVGLPTQKTIKVKGIKSLRKELENTKDKFVKLNTFRGDVETFKHLDWETSGPIVDDLAFNLGPKQERVEFLIEDQIEGCEPGFDGIVYDGKYMSPTMWGFELKGGAYFGKIGPYKDVPKPLRKVNKGFSKILEQYKTRFFFSTEVLITKQQTPYLIDLTIRHAAPAVSAIQSELIENFSQVIWGLGTGVPIIPRMKYKYAAGVTMESDWADKHWLKVQFPKEMRRWVKFRLATKFDDGYYVVPGFNSLGTIIALGNSVEEVAKLVKDRAGQVKSISIEPSLGAFERLHKEIQDLKQYGIDF